MINKISLCAVCHFLCLYIYTYMHTQHKQMILLSCNVAFTQVLLMILLVYSSDQHLRFHIKCVEYQTILDRDKYMHKYWLLNNWLWPAVFQQKLCCHFTRMSDGNIYLVMMIPSVHLFASQFFLSTFRILKQNILV